jgi:hypothetical protein
MNWPQAGHIHRVGIEAETIGMKKRCRLALASSSVRIAKGNVSNRCDLMCTVLSAT